MVTYGKKHNVKLEAKKCIDDFLKNNRVYGYYYDDFYSNPLGKLKMEHMCNLNCSDYDEVERVNRL